MSTRPAPKRAKPHPECAVCAAKKAKKRPAPPRTIKYAVYLEAMTKRHQRLAEAVGETTVCARTTAAVGSVLKALQATYEDAAARHYDVAVEAGRSTFSVEDARQVARQILPAALFAEADAFASERAR